MKWWVAAAASLPWVLVPVILALRARGSRWLSEFSAIAPHGAPLVSVVIPARNEAESIERCARSVLRSSYPRLEVIVVDDRSEDGTGEIARRVALDDERLRVISANPLPQGWFGKQWACTQGAAATTGDILCFTDADTQHGDDLMVRSVNGMLDRRADLFSVLGAQEMESFWERLVQPQMFAMLTGRYGSTEVVNRSTRVFDKVANGQFFLVRRAAYLELGGHEIVRGKVAEDLALAQLFFARGKRTMLVAGLDQLSTRMYRSLGALLRGWMKNVYAGGIYALPGGGNLAGRLAAPVLLLAPVAMMLTPPAVLFLSTWVATAPAITAWAAIATGAMLLFWLAVYALHFRLPPWYALLFPLGGLVVLYIIVRAVLRGRRVAWKGREYRSD